MDGYDEEDNNHGEIEAYLTDEVLIEKADAERLRPYTWCKNEGGYAFTIDPTTHRIVYMHRFIVDAPKGKIVDHINGHRLDNRRCNLRIVTKRQNKINTGITRKDYGGYKGVKFNFDNNTWYAEIGDEIIGGYGTAEEAAEVYDVRATQLYGRFARLNFPDRDCVDKKATCTVKLQDATLLFKETLPAPIKKYLVDLPAKYERRKQSAMRKADRLKEKTEKYLKEARARQRAPSPERVKLAVPALNMLGLEKSDEKTGGGKSTVIDPGVKHLSYKKTWMRPINPHDVKKLVEDGILPA